MYGRMIHTADSQHALCEEAQLYDVHGRYQRAVDRASLNKVLLSELENLQNVKLVFHRKLTGVDFEKRKAWFEARSESNRNGQPDEVEIDFDIILGCDGAHSSVRHHMMKFARIDYEQSYIDVLWCEFIIPPMTSSSASTTPSAKDGFATSPNHLHIWPGSDKMFIAIPSTDKSFTCTLFADFKTFALLEQKPESIDAFFQDAFPGAAELVGHDNLERQFKSNPHLPLISIKCSPHHYTSTGVILGDAAHAMVPFYGQGMNAGLEDVRILFEHLDLQHNTAEGRLIALEAYNSERVADAHTINDLALGNYWEMHAGVQSKLYMLRKRVEEFLSDKMPWTGFATQYSRVSFSNQRYSEVVKSVERQGRMLRQGALATSLLLPLLSWMMWFLLKRGRRVRSNDGSAIRKAIDTMRARLRQLVHSIQRP